MSKSSYRAILRSSSIIGGAQVVTILASLAKMKVAAVLLGPVGVGLAGLYVNLIQTGAAVASLGVGTVGVRQIAAKNTGEDDVALGRVRRALFWGTTALALLGGVVFWLCSGWIARVVLANEDLAPSVAWLSVGVALSVASGSQAALLTGLQRMGDLARTNIGSGVIGALCGILAIRLWGDKGIIVMVLLAPALSFVFGRIYTTRLGRPAGPRAHLPELLDEWRELIRIGVPFMASSLLLVLGQFAVRALVQRELNLKALGQFQAAWNIGITYLGFVLGAMATDYFPRLTSAIGDRVATTRLVNEQTEVAILLCAPAILALLGFSPWLIPLLYSSDFGPAVEVLRWQLLGDVAKIIAFPMGFVILAMGAGRTFFLLELLTTTVLVLGVFIGLPLIGVSATGVAYLLVYVILLPINWLLVHRYIDFHWTRAVRLQTAGIVCAAAAVEFTIRCSQPAGAALAAILSLAAGVWALLRMSAVAGAGGRLGKISAYGERLQSRLRSR